MSLYSPIVLQAIAFGERLVISDLLATTQFTVGDGMLVCLAYLHETNYQPSKIQKIALPINNQTNNFIVVAYHFFSQKITMHL